MKKFVYSAKGADARHHATNELGGPSGGAPDTAPVLRGLLKALPLALLGALHLFASIDGTVVNRTSGKPAAGVSITLLKPGAQGMQTLGSTLSNSTGHFAFEKDRPGGGPQLLQASYRGVTYNKLLTPNMPTSNIDLDIYEATKSPAVAKIAQHMLLLEPSSSQLAVDETAVIENGTTTTYNNDALGALQFYLPPAANGQVRVSAQGPQGMPLPRPAEKTDQNDIFKVNFPVKPGETQIQVTYVLPIGSPLTFRGRVVNVKGMQAGPLRLVVPPGVILAGNDVERIGTEPRSQATIYNVKPAGGFSVEVAGRGSLRGGDESASADDSESPGITEGRPQIYRHLPWLVVLILSILAVGFAVLYRSSPVRSPHQK
ncbi:MAG TPA: carboxypeptidase-like regulatory domain-containing protein [Bryobacteraceae bacterium]|nr:carboxypeptidase-like regulatory domain-containing protein [Bryobacteraceae bacterium]